MDYSGNTIPGNRKFLFIATGFFLCKNNDFTSCKPAGKQPTLHHVNSTNAYAKRVLTAYWFEPGK